MRGFISRAESEKSVDLVLGGDLVGSTVRLWTAIANPLSPRSVNTDFTEAAFDGYAGKVLGAKVGPYINPQGEASIVFPLLAWLMTGSTTPEVVRGWYILAPGTTFLAGGQFDQPVNMLDETSALLLVLEPALSLSAIIIRAEPLT